MVLVNNVKEATSAKAVINAKVDINKEDIISAETTVQANSAKVDTSNVEIMVLVNNAKAVTNVKVAINAETITLIKEKADNVAIIVVVILTNKDKDETMEDINVEMMGVVNINNEDEIIITSTQEVEMLQHAI